MLNLDVVMLPLYNMKCKEISIVDFIILIVHSFLVGTVYVTGYTVFFIFKVYNLLFSSPLKIKCLIL